MELCAKRNKEVVRIVKLMSSEDEQYMFLLYTLGVSEARKNGAKFHAAPFCYLMRGENPTAEYSSFARSLRAFASYKLRRGVYQDNRTSPRSGQLRQVTRSKSFCQRVGPDRNMNLAGSCYHRGQE